jgi:DNA excision repair protein ERCC-2
VATTDDGYERFFPYEEPYEHQRDAMGRVADALEGGQDVLFEGACGTGKTLAALAPALDHARETNKTVVITTNVHQQMRQFITEARAITRQEPVQAVVFRGKNSMCHIDVGYEECQVLRDTTREVVEKEQEVNELEQRQRDLLARSQAGDEAATEARGAVMDELDSLEEDLADLQDASVCDYYYNNLTADTDEFYAWLYDDVRTPDDIYEYADRQGLCGYELLKEGMEGVDLVVCNYHHLLDPVIRQQFFRWLGRDPEDIIAVFDEAHNVEGAARDHATRQLTETTVEGAIDELAERDDPRAEAGANVLTAFLRALRDTYEPATYGSVGEHWEDVAVANEDGRDDLTLAFLEGYSGPGIREDLEEALAYAEELDAEYERRYREGETTSRRECQTLQAGRFVEGWLDDGGDAGQHPVVSVRRRDGGDVYGRAELYACIPQDVTRSLLDDLHATVLMSATLRPFDVTEDVLGLDDPETMAYGPQFPTERRRTYAVETPALFASKRDDPGVQRTYTEAIQDAIRFTPGNTLVYFPSYAEAERYHERVSIEGECLLDRPGTRAENLRQRFVDHDDAALFTSLWGTLTEGVSFDDDDARSVVVVGVPYPHLDDRMEAVQAAYDGAFDGEEAGWRYAVEIPTVRKTRQAVGRVVRSPSDYGARVLLDERYTERSHENMRKYSVRSAFPPDERTEMLDITPQKLKFGLLNFYGDLDAYDGAPPEP